MLIKFGCPKRHPDALLAKTMLPGPLDRQYNFMKLTCVQITITGNILLRVQSAMLSENLSNSTVLDRFGLSHVLRPLSHERATVGYTC